MVKIKSYVTEPKSFFLKFLLEDLAIHPVHLSFWDEDLISPHHIKDLANPKITMQQGGIETFLILGKQNNIALDLSVKWLS